MKNLTNGKRWRSLFAAASVASLIVFGMMLAINFYVQHHGAANGEHSWVYSFVVLQGIPFSVLLMLLSLVGLGNVSNVAALCILASLADCLAVFLLLLILGTFAQLIRKGKHEDKK
jgi:hypothetical protein